MPQVPLILCCPSLGPSYLSKEPWLLTVTSGSQETGRNCACVLLSVHMETHAHVCDPGFSSSLLHRETCLGTQTTHAPLPPALTPHLPVLLTQTMWHSCCYPAWFLFSCFLFLEVLGFEARVLHLLYHWSRSASPFCFSYFFAYRLPFSPQAGVHHHAQLTCSDEDHTSFFPRQYSSS
jgi:hypothetical protein